MVIIHIKSLIYFKCRCPTHPAVFSTVDGSGTLELWNLNEETEVPITKTSVGTRALNRIQWSSDGKKILTGDSLGSLYIYDTGEVRLFIRLTINIY